jgi:hypothetical protein
MLFHAEQGVSSEGNGQNWGGVYEMKPKFIAARQTRVGIAANISR